MDVLEVDSKNYVKASDIARELGYTSDYVGQLCRSGKVDAKLIGRSWYVDSGSIRSHKGSRYRSSQVKSIKAIKEIIAEDDTEVEKNRQPSVENNSPRFYIHNSLSKPSPTYTSDETELLPQVGTQAKKLQTNLRVNLADAASVKVSSLTESYTLNVGETPTIKFRGSLAVTDIETDKAPAPEGSVLLKINEVSVLTGEKMAHNKVISSKAKIVHHSKNTTKLVPIDLDPQIVTKIVTAEENAVVTNSTFSSSILFFSTTVLSLLCVAFIFGSEVQVTATAGTFVTEYNFKVGNLLASVYSVFL